MATLPTSDLSAHDLPTPELPARRGRPSGWRAPTFADRHDLVLEDFAFVRAVMTGAPAEQAFARAYANWNFDGKGNAHPPPSLDTKELVEQLKRRMAEAGSQKDAPGLRSAAHTLATALTGKRNAEQALTSQQTNDGLVDAVDAGLHALAQLQSVASRPTTSSATSQWFAADLCRSLQGLGIATMGELITYVGHQGRHWHRAVERLGAGRAKRLLAWLDSHSDVLGPIVRDGPAWRNTPVLSTRLQPLQRVASAVQLVHCEKTGFETPAPFQITQRFGCVPIEMLTVPIELDGHDGVFRTTTPNHLGANNDYEAIGCWLNGYLQAGKVRTMDAYRREAERFYLWCLLEKECALSSITLLDAQGYQAFLQTIPAHFISTARVCREDSRWRPWRGQLSAQSQNFALGIVEQLFTFLQTNSYLTGNPFAGIRPPVQGVKQRTMDTTRSLHAEDLAAVRRALDALPGLHSPDLLHAAIARRTRLILHLALTTGLRLSEMVFSDLSGLRRAIVDGAPADDWVLPVVGKGSRSRDVPISATVRSFIEEHHRDWEVLMPQAYQRMLHFKKHPPLFAALSAPIRSTSRVIDSSTVLANDNAALSRAGVWRTLKTFFRQLSNEATNPTQRARIQAFSTHHLRHTFAHEVLRENAGDDGLKLAQQLLGHRSIATTAEYCRQNESAKVKAARKVRPLG